MARTSEDLKALLMAGDEYRETIDIEYLGEQFAIQIRPLTEAELVDVNRQMRISMKMYKTLFDKIKVGRELTAEESETAKEEAFKALMADDSVNLTDITMNDFLVDRAYCQKGIVDDGLKTMVGKFRYGLTKKIAERIRLISEVPPGAIANFFGQTKASSS